MNNICIYVYHSLKNNYLFTPVRVLEGRTGNFQEYLLSRPTLVDISFRALVVGEISTKKSESKNLQKPTHFELLQGKYE